MKQCNDDDNADDYGYDGNYYYDNEDMLYRYMVCDDGDDGTFTDIYTHASVHIEQHVPFTLVGGLYHTSAHRTVN